VHAEGPPSTEGLSASCGVTAARGSRHEVLGTGATDGLGHSADMDDSDQTDRLRDAWDEAEAVLAAASDPNELATLRARAEAAHETYLRAEEADAIDRRAHPERAPEREV